MLRQILEGLSATHELNVYHADLMLDNIFVMPLGQIKLANFFAELPTAYYMAPESFNKLESGPREEMWAVGCTMHEMVSGRPAFRSNSKDKNSMADIKIRVQEQYPRRLNPQISRVLRTMIFRMLSKEKEERPSVEELLESKLLEVSEAGVQLIQPKGPTPSVEAISKDEEVRKSYVPQGNEQTLHCQSTKDYIDEGLRATDMINMSCWGIQAPCPFVPSREALLEESPLAVYKQSLTALLHDEGEMSRTTF
jgi:serine/threonine protein kinase